MSVTAIVLASGFGRRFGGNKLLAPYEGKPLVQHILEKIVHQDFKECIVVTQYAEIISLAQQIQALGTKPITCIYNAHADEGISASIKLGVDTAKPCEGYMFFSADMPLLTEKTISDMLQLFKQVNTEGQLILAAEYANKRANPVIFASHYRKELLALAGDIGGRQVLKRHLDKVKTYKAEAHEHIDIDTREVYQSLICKN